MKRVEIKNSCLIVLIAAMCFSFCSYILLSPFKVHYQISVSDLSEEDAKGAEESPKELVAVFEAQQETLDFHLEVVKKEVRYEQIKLPAHHTAPSTPPPDLA